MERNVVVSMKHHEQHSGRPFKEQMQQKQNFIHRQLKRENEKKLGKCIRQITNDCKDMLKKKLEEIDAYNSTLTQNKYRKHKCFICKKKGHISTSCPMKHEEENKAENKAETSTQNPHQTDINCTQKPTIELKYREVIHFPTHSILKGTDQGHWDDIWYISNSIDKHLCSNLNSFRNIKEDFVVSKLKDQMKFLFTYGIGEVIIKDDGRGVLIPGVLYAPEVTLNILSTDLLTKQGFNIVYEENRCRLVYMFNNFEEHVFNEDSLRKRHNDFLETYFESLANSEDDVIKINEVDKYSPLSQQEALAPKQSMAEIKGKEKLEHFGVILEDEEKKKAYTKPTLPHCQNRKIKEEAHSNSSDDFTIIP
ncbi:ARID DNA-binding domain-containing protein [Artemisia annua]|uniref:ARID DNA-binding domain-containing protein n=1 Tax=Artemisia annua TaxID=35608 RepID=A0A2U1N7N1_ARTAN|nr:ARID DNA-binding domain-containing protein [Artemisia annua]